MAAMTMVRSQHHWAASRVLHLSTNEHATRGFRMEAQAPGLPPLQLSLPRAQGTQPMAASPLLRQPERPADRGLTPVFLRRKASNQRALGRRAGARAAVAGEVGESEGFRLPPNELPKGQWQRLLVGAERGFNVFATGSVIKVLDVLYKDRPYARFYVLETIARVPYFAFMSVLHMYESFGWWRRADYLKVHFAESWNELHHLLIMEALGGDRRWFDRFLAQHVAVAYFFMTATMYTLSPRMAYHFSECVEEHAYATYDKFLKAHGEALKEMPPPEVAVRYYTEGDLYMFDEFQTSGRAEIRRPKVETLYDVFHAIREDEAEHCKTMRACQTPSALLSPHRDFVATAPSCSNVEGELNDARVQVILPPAECAGIIECAITSTSYAERMEKSEQLAVATNKRVL